ncbi:YqiA/YcfP family alpha/beta fold hydrolase [Vibrio diabolicus]
MTLPTDVFNETYDSLIPIECFLNRVFPPGFYDNEIEGIVHKRLFKPRKDCEPYQLVSPIDWEGSIHSSDRNWRMQLQGWAMFHPIMNIFDTFENKELLVDYFFDIVTDWMEKHGSDNDHTTTSRMPSSYAWYDMSVGFRALVLAFFINRISYHKLNIDQSRCNLLARAAEKHLNNLCFSDAFSLNNHGLFQIQGLMALINLTTFSENSERKKYALEKMEELIFSQFTREGIHKEHSPHYHFYATDTALSIIKTGWYSSSKTIEDIVLLADKNKCWMVDPLKRPVCVGDSILTEQKRLTLPDGSGEKTIVGDFSESGYSIVKSDWQGDVDTSHMLFLTGMYHTKSHKHRDCLSFELFNNGTRLLCDSGKYGYRSDKYRNYFLSHRAHNTVEIEGFDIIKIKPYQTCLNAVVKDKNDNYILEGKLDYPAIKHHRKLSYKPNNWLLVEDNLQFARGRSFTQWFHLGIGFELVSYKNGYYKFINKSNQVIEIECLNKELETTFSFGDESAMQGFISEKDYMYEKAVAIGFSGNAKACNVQTIIRYSNDTSFKEYLSTDRGAGQIVSDELKSSLKQPLLKNIKNFFFENENINIPQGKSTISCLVDDVPLQFYSERKKKADSLLIMLPGATNRAKGYVDFQRHSWSEDINCHVVSFSDPTISSENELSIGWFQYKEKVNCIASLSKAITAIAKNLNIDQKNVCIFGSSAGGFTSLKVSEYLPEPTVIAINPQLYLNLYTRSHFESMVNYSYNGKDIESKTHPLHERISISSEKIKQRSNHTYIVQNSDDVRHYERHLKRFINEYSDENLNFNEVNNWHEIKSTDGLNIVIYKDPELSHSPPNRSDTLELIKFIFKNA